MIRLALPILASLALLVPLAALRAADPVPASTAPAAPVDFDRDVKPILAANCFACHGPDEHERKAGVRLDTKAGLLGAGKDGKVVVVPGKADESEIVRRITNPDVDERMPPTKAGKTLKLEQIETI